MDVDQTVTLRFSGPSTALYEVSYIGIDVYQLLAFSRLIELGDHQQLDDYFGEKSPPLTRYTGILRTYRQYSPKISARSGSYEIILQHAPLLAAIIVPLLAVYVQRRLQKSDETVSFEVAVQDQELQHLIEEYAAGRFGFGDSALRELFESLRYRGYDITAQQQDLFVIQHVLTKYSHRIVRTLKKNMRTKDF